MHKMQFENERERTLYMAAFQHGAEYMLDAWAEMQARGRMTVNDRRLALRCFNREMLAKPVPGDKCALSFVHLENFNIGFDKHGFFKATER